MNILIAGIEIQAQRAQLFKRDGVMFEQYNKRLLDSAVLVDPLAVQSAGAVIIEVTNFTQHRLLLLCHAMNQQKPILCLYTPHCLPVELLQRLGDQRHRVQIMSYVPHNVEQTIRSFILKQCEPLTIMVNASRP